MKTHFSDSFFIGNRTELQKKLGKHTLIIIAGTGAMQRGADEPSAFHQDSNFWYLTGLNGVDLTLVIHGDETFVIVPTLSFVRQAFDGEHDIAAYAARSGIRNFMTSAEGWKQVRSLLVSQATVATLASPPAYLPRHGLHTLPYRRRLITKLKRMHPAVTVQDIRQEMASMRCIKQPAELAALQQAIDITALTLNEITEPKRLKATEHEYELEALLSYGFRSRGATGHAFSPIVGAGSHATTLHYLSNSGPIGHNDLVVLDVGAEVEHYAADISRTVSKQPIIGRQADVFNSVARVQDYALGLLKPGLLLHDYESAIETRMGEELIALGLVKDTSREAIRHYYPHATSHFLGLDTHDVGDYLEPLQEGMVVTCEPGIYIPEESIGVRIEDDILITKSGNTMLSAACPRTLTPVQ